MVLLVFQQKSVHISAVHKSSRRLAVAQRVDFKAALLVHKSFYGLAPTYISDMLVPHEPPSDSEEIREKPSADAQSRD